MDHLSLLPGLIGGFLAALLILFLSKRVRHARRPGHLQYGWGILLLGMACLGFSGLALWAWFHDLDAPYRLSERLSIAGLFIGFGIAAIYSFGEYFGTRGEFNDQGILFRSPWTGRKQENWEDLESVDFNEWANWYRLAFRDGRVIRLSTLLSGHGDVLDLLTRRGYLKAEPD